MTWTELLFSCTLPGKIRASWKVQNYDSAIATWNQPYCMAALTLNVTEPTVSQLQSFINECLWYVPNTRWLEAISMNTYGRWPINNQLDNTQQRASGNGLATLRKPNGAAEKLALDWNHQGARRRGCTRMTGRGSKWRWWTWSEIKRLASNRKGRACFVTALHFTTKSDRIWWWWWWWWWLRWQLFTISY